jgi:hypothetical protein
MLEHAQNFWKWLSPIPSDQSPMEDPTGEKCTNGQANSNSSVFYLAYNSRGRSEGTCEVPVGKGLLIPATEVEWNNLETSGASIADVHTSATKDQDSANSLSLRSSIDIHNHLS